MNSDRITDDEAAAIVHAARRRALGSRKRLRLLAVVLWSGFLGACGLFTALLLAPSGFADPHLSHGHLVALFSAAWVLSLIPALVAGMLLMNDSDTKDPGAQP